MGREVEAPRAEGYECKLLRTDIEQYTTTAAG